MIFIFLGVVVGLGLTVYGVMTVRQVDEAMMARLQRFELQPAQSLSQLELQIPRSERLLGPPRRWLAKRVRSITPAGTIDSIQQKIAMAGNPRDITVQDFLGLKGLFCVGGIFVVFVFLTFIVHTGTIRFIIALAIGGALGYFMPDLWIRREVKARQKEIQKFLADAIDILAISVEAGQGFDGAIVTLSARKKNALTYEFDRFRTEIQAGKGRREAFRDLAARTGVEDLTQFVAAMIQADQLGIGITQVLRSQAEELRIKRRQRAEEQARKAPIKMLFPLILLMFPSLLMVILGPSIHYLMFLH